MKREFVVGVVGNPNVGKSTIFNELTGARQHIGNYPGVTVEKKEGVMEVDSFRFRLVDLPGIYSLTSFSPDELVARNFIINEKPDMVVDIIDSSNLERNLYLTLQLMEFGVPVLLVLNMSDEACRKGIKIDVDCMSNRFGVPVVKTVGHKGKGIDDLKEKLVCLCKKAYKINYSLKYGEDIDNALWEIKSFVDEEDLCNVNTFWVALKLLEKDEGVEQWVKEKSVEHKRIFKILDEKRSLLESLFGEDINTIIATARYGIISGVVAECVRKVDIQKRHEISDKIDLVLTHRLFGLPIFFLLMYLVFWFTFKAGSIPMQGIENAMDFLASKIDILLPHHAYLKSLIKDGIIGGVGAVLVFLPNIAILFLAIGVLEYSGYMARAAFIVDKIMHKIGLHGQSFIPMIIGFGCNVPAIMATRTLESKRERLITILILPFMSCGARLPIYILIIETFFPIKYHTLLLWVIYITGIFLAVLSAKILKGIIFKGESSPFVMELPPYRIPTIKSLVIYMWGKTSIYLKKAGTIILLASMVLWFLSSFPKPDHYSMDFDGEIQKIKSVFTLDEKKRSEIISELINQKMAEEIENSYMGKIGKFLEPIFKPLGFDWKIATAIIGALAAKEVFVSQLAVINRLGTTEEESPSLKEILRRQYSPLIGFCIMLWALVSAPCIATFATTKQETGSWIWAIAQFLWTTSMAYVLTLLTYQTGRILL